MSGSAAGERRDAAPNGLSAGRGRQDTNPDTGAALGLPLAFTWADLVDRLAAERGSLAELARVLQEIAPAGAGVSPDPLTVERGLRRLRARGSAEGDKYGRLLLRFFGLPPSLIAWARLMGQYHSRLSDLPVPLRQEQLQLWDRPPIAESPAAAWIHLGLATLARRRGQPAEVARRLDLAARLAPRAEPAARLELALFRAALAVDEGGAGDALLAEAEALLRDAALGAEDRACYAARLADQRAYQRARGWREDPLRLRDALALYESIEPANVPFAAFRREHGRAWCLWRLGEAAAARRCAEAAAGHAGDGGLLQMRCLALTLLAHILDPGPDRQPALRRALAIAEALEDERLLAPLRPLMVG